MRMCLYYIRMYVYIAMHAENLLYFHVDCNVKCLFSLFISQDKSMYDATHELEYLDMVLTETFRLYPPASS